MIVLFSTALEIFSVPDPHLLVLREEERLGKVCEDEYFGCGGVGKGNPVPMTGVAGTEIAYIKN
jgi:hypothetical protein